MMVGVAFAPDDLRTEMAKRIFKALRRGDAGKCADGLVPQPVEGKFLSAPDILHHLRRVIALDDLGRGVIAADLLLDGGDVAAALREKDDVGPFEIPHRLAQDAPRQQVAVAERIGRVDQHDFNRMLQLLILEPVVQDERVATKTVDGITPGLHPVTVDDNGDTRQIRGKHVRLVAAGGGIQENTAPVRHDQGLFNHLREQALPPRRLLAPVTAGENRHLAPLGRQRAREDFGHGCLARAAGRHIADRDDLCPKGIAAEKAGAVEKIADADNHQEQIAETLENMQKQVDAERLVQV